MGKTIKKPNIKQTVFLHISILIFSATGIFSKMAANIHADIQKCELDISDLYRKLNTIKSQAQSLMKGGEIPDE